MHSGNLKNTVPGSHPKGSDLIDLGEGLGTGILQRSSSESNMQPGLRTIGSWDSAEGVKEETIQEEEKQKGGVENVKQSRGFPEIGICQQG